MLFKLYSLLSCIGRSGIALKVLSGVGVEGFLASFACGGGRKKGLNRLCIVCRNLYFR